MFRTFLIAVLIAFVTVFGPAKANALPWEELPRAELKHEFIQTLFKWKPRGFSEAPVSRECRRAALEKTIERGGSPVEIEKRINSWLARCEHEINRFNSGQFGVLLEYTNIEHSLRNDSEARKVSFTLSDGRKLFAIVGLKNDGIRRPLIVAKCGLYCDANEGATTKSLFMHLFEESPFNVVILASATGPEFSIANQSIAFGGFDEGYQINDVIRQILDPAKGFPDLVSTVHVIGFSMGSHGALYSGLYSSMPENSMPHIDSVMAVCPVVDLGPTIKDGFSGSARGVYYQLLSLQVLRRIFTYVPIIGDILNVDRRLSRQELYTGLTKAAVTYYKSLTETAPWSISPLRGLQIASEVDLWNANHFQDHADKVRVPTLLLHFKDDYFVESKINADILSAQLKTKANDSIGIVGFERGNHCALSAANGWETMTTLLRSYILAYSEHARSFMGPSRVSIGRHVSSWRWPMNLKLWKNEVIVGTGFEISAHEDEVALEIRIFNPYGNGGGSQDCSASMEHPALAPTDCIRLVRGHLPLELFKTQGLRTPKTVREAAAMSRWLNTNSDIVTAKGEPFIGANEAPADVLLRGRYEQ